MLPRILVESKAITQEACDQLLAAVEVKLNRRRQKYPALVGGDPMDRAQAMLDTTKPS
jgi:hypothetical protein